MVDCTEVKAVWIVADTTITYAGQRTSPTTVTICAYASVSVPPFAADTDH